MKGLFITFEGIEGCGKSTQIDMLNVYLKEMGRSTLLTREPGGTDIGERIRAILMDASHANMSPVTELLLYGASRNQHIFEKIGPAIALGKIVLSDRYADATTAYQGAARCIDDKTIEALHEIATGGLKPDVTFLLDCPAEVGLSRAISRNQRDPEMQDMDRFEREKMDFHMRVRDGYLAIAKREPERVVIIDATLGIEEMHKDIVTKIGRFIGKES